MSDERIAQLGAVAAGSQPILPFRAHAAFNPISARIPPILLVTSFNVPRSLGELEHGRMSSMASDREPEPPDLDPSDYLFGRAVRIICGCLAFIVAISQIAVLSTDEIICHGHYVLWRDFGSLIWGDWTLLWRNQAEWQVMPNYNPAAVLQAAPIGMLGSLGFALVFLARKAWRYAPFIVLAGSIIGFCLVPVLGLLAMIKTFQAFGNM